MNSGTSLRPHRNLLRAGLVLAVLALWALTGCSQSEARTPASAQSRQAAIHRMQSLDQWQGYFQAHDSNRHPMELLGGPIEVTVRQNVGGVLVGLPDHRKLDPVVFGPDDLPRHYSGTPIITGVPPMMRVKGADGTEQTSVLTPFGDKHIALPNGHLYMQLLDKTAVDAATTEDRVKFDASWQDAHGNTYEVKCCAKLAAHGLEYPTFGGVETNMLMHGVSNVGTPLMPTLFSYAAFWGFGEVDMNGKTLAKPRLIHVMLTEYVREAGYALDFDKDVQPNRLHLHVMVPPMMPDPSTGHFKPSPVHTGFVLPNGKELPFWHVMFESLNVEAHRERAH